MITFPPVFVIDDQQEKLDVMSAAVASLTASKEVLGVDLHQILVNTPDEYVNARKRLSAVAGGGVIFLDLAFRRSDTQARWPEVIQDLRQLSIRTGLNYLEAEKGGADALMLEIPEGESVLRGLALDGLGLIEIILQNQDLSPCVVIPCSSEPSINDLYLFLDIFNKAARKAGRRVVFVRDPSGRNFGSLPAAKGLLRDLEGWWVTNFPHFSIDHRIEATIREWLGYYRSLGKAMSPPGGFCGHDHIENERNRRAYAQILEKGLGCVLSSAALDDSEGLKGLFKVDVSVSEVGWPSAAFGAWPSKDDSFGDSSKPLKREMWEAVLKAISGLELSMPGIMAKLPVTPGLPFVLALRSVFESLWKEKMLDTNGRVVILSGGEVGTRLTIPLTQVPRMEFGLARTWLKKVEEGRGTLNRGVCGHLWNLAKARVSLSTAGMSDSNEESLNSERRLLELFEGPGRPVVSLYFAPHFIHLYWS
jgi:hypothetical protein